MWDLKPFETENISKIHDVLMFCESLLRREVQLGSDESEEVVHSLSHSLDVKCKTIIYLFSDNFLDLNPIMY